MEKGASHQEMVYPISAVYAHFMEFFNGFAYATFVFSLALFSVDVLSYDESMSTTLFHLQNILSYLFTIIGGILADSSLGKFKTTVYALLLFMLGSTILTVTAIPTLNLPMRELFVACLIIISVNSGTLKSSITCLGADQFVLPQQQIQFTSYFSYYMFTAMSGQLIASIATPLLRKEVTCFDSMTCYPLVFLVQIFSSILVFVFLMIGMRRFNITKSHRKVGNNFFTCIFYALYKKITSKEKYDHWLDYANSKHDDETIKNIKNTLELIILILPLSTYAALNGQQGSSWTFQAARTNGDIGFYTLLPDQMMIVHTIGFIIFIPIFHNFVFPFLEKRTFFNTPLRLMAFGGFFASLAFFVAAIMEVNLEPTYAKVPTHGFAQLRIFNTYNCDISMIVENEKFTLEKLDMWENISIPTNGEVSLQYKIDMSRCSNGSFFRMPDTGEITVKENHAISWVIAKSSLSYKYTDNVDKSKTGNPLIRTLISIDKSFPSTTATLHFVKNGRTSKSIPISKNFQASELNIVNPGHYNLYIDDRLVESDVMISQGGVYAVVGHVSDGINQTYSARTLTVTQPNTVSMFWLLPQHGLQSIADVAINVKGVEFVYAAAPPSMKSIGISWWYFTYGLGSFIVIVFTAAHMFNRKIYDFIFYAVLNAISIIIFSLLAKFYKRTGDCNQDSNIDSEHTEVTNLENNDK